MTILRYGGRLIARFCGGVAAFFGLLIALAAILGLLLAALVCAVFVAWAVINFGFYLLLHDPQTGHIALWSIMVAAGCFAGLCVFWSVVFDLYRRATRSRSEPFEEPSVEHRLQQEPHHLWHYDYAAPRL